uniref:Transposon Ty3-G Gag-Pol polyprotein n=1 Tax=Cajanus cajan TaxID=3821 RepID=A0A151R7L4_CAJCA|nr:Transposon Ty3-G Gag-Pol polyprotein [Cajanus cajan]
MTRNNPGILHPFDPEIDRTFLRLVREHIVPPPESDNHSVSVASEVDSTKNMGDQPTPRERTLREMVAPDFTYESLCIQYPEEDVPFVLQTGLIHLLPKLEPSLKFFIPASLTETSTCTYSPTISPVILDVVKKEVTKLLQAGIIYPISNSYWVSPVQMVPKKIGLTVVKNKRDELIPTRVQNSWRVCIDYRRLNQATRKDHFPLPFIDHMLERLAGKSHYYFLDGFSDYFQIHIALKDQEKTTFTYPFGTFAYRRMPFGLCNAPGTFQRCMLSIFSDFLENYIEVFIDDFTVYGSSFDACLDSLDRVMNTCIETNLVLNFEKCHFMV